MRSLHVLELRLAQLRAESALAVVTAKGRCRLCGCVPGKRCTIDLGGGQLGVCAGPFEDQLCSVCAGNATRAETSILGGVRPCAPLEAP